MVMIMMVMSDDGDNHTGSCGDEDISVTPYFRKIKLKGRSFRKTECCLFFSA
jgi:hypothetical protein